ncbi:hypothetical protein KC19_12G116000 [Ceratodon purpureus]|uniref:Uncharacterized protein n=1 Tax=Ceratodon purpureus TaxID=3225 RepID=A0A8T0G663_CERPU|nr:hypothetical protein KC19_12G116000 [Ceratodon purpureus]
MLVPILLQIASLFFSLLLLVDSCSMSSMSTLMLYYVRAFCEVVQFCCFETSVLKGELGVLD